MEEIQIPSTRDAELQNLRFTAGDAGAPLVIFLHTWSGSYKMEEPAWVELATKRGWSLSSNVKFIFVGKPAGRA